MSVVGRWLLVVGNGIKCGSFAGGVVFDVNFIESLLTNPYLERIRKATHSFCPDL